MVNNNRHKLQGLVSRYNFEASQNPNKMNLSLGLAQARPLRFKEFFFKRLVLMLFFKAVTLQINLIFNKMTLLQSPQNWSDWNKINLSLIIQEIQVQGNLFV